MQIETAQSTCGCDRISFVQYNGHTIGHRWACMLRARNQFQKINLVDTAAASTSYVRSTLPPGARDRTLSMVGKLLQGQPLETQIETTQDTCGRDRIFCSLKNNGHTIGHRRACMVRAINLSQKTNSVDSAAVGTGYVRSTLPFGARHRTLSMVRKLLQERCRVTRVLCAWLYT